MPLNEELPEYVDVLIVGSGFGGSVMAAELARAKREDADGNPVKICVVERGKAYPPGSFPRDPAGVSKNFWDPDAGLYGMFDVWSFDKMDAVISSGLGGGSLIYANVLLRKDATWFTQRMPDSLDTDERWMITAAELEPHYEEILKFLRVQELPHEPGIPDGFLLAKTTRFLQSTYKANIPKLPKLPGEPKYGPRRMGPTAEKYYAMGIADTEKPLETEVGYDIGGYAPLAVRFRDDDANAAIGAPLEPEEYGSIHGTTYRTTCTMVGECDVGCNQGAKNTLDHTYLSETLFNEASIHTLTEVVGLKHYKDGRDYPFEVTVQSHHVPKDDYAVDTVGQPVPPYGSKDEAQQIDQAPPDDDSGAAAATERTIYARRVVLAAGTLGTTFLLLKNEDRLGIARIEANGKAVLGSRFCGNGDFLAFVKGAKGRLDSTRGPVITAYRRYPAETDPAENPDAPDPGKDGKNTNRHGMYIEDAGYPAFAAWLVQLAQAGTMGKNVLNVWLKRKLNSKDQSDHPPDGDANLSAELNQILVGGEFSSKVMPLLGMGRDRPTGRFRLNAGKTQLLCDWTVDPSESFYDAMQRRMNTIALGFGGELLSNPLFKVLKRGITVHPVGGCPMDTTKAEGIVDDYGRVRGVPGLRVCDGSVFPGPIGPNPSLTIAAFARRSAGNLLEEEDWSAPPPEASEYSPEEWEHDHPEKPSEAPRAFRARRF